MALFLLIASIVVLICVLLNTVSHKLGMPMLITFIALGILFGSDGILKISFNNFALAEQICSFALIIIIFYGGFGTKWSEAKPVAAKSLLLSSVGVVITAGLTGLFCHFVLHFDLLESLLIGAVISSTDAASVFSILRSKRLNLKDRTASMLEVESGSNDPCAYMLTIILLSIMGGKATVGGVSYLIFAQLVYGAVFGFVIAYIAFYFVKKFKFATNGFDAAFLLAIAVAAYAIPSVLGGNGYLSAYIAGIILGNKPLKNKKSLVNFFDGLTGLMQILIFFLLGLLAFPSHIPEILLPSIAIALFLTLVARPVAVFAILAPTKCKFSQELLVSWTGLRGAASIVFAIMVMISDVYIETDIFHIIFCIVLMSIAIQGTLLPFFAKKLNLLDENANVLKTFSDYSDEIPVQFIKLVVGEEHPWIDSYVKDVSLPPETLLVLVLRNKERIIPDGNTAIRKGDVIVLSAPEFHDDTDISITELIIDANSDWQGTAICEIDHNFNGIIIMVKRGGKVIIPNGQTVLQENDVLVFFESV
ncbi:MAG: potassium/proton antiporter [Clostridiales bacterium]